MSTKDFNLAELRKKARLTQADLAQTLHISQARVSKYEANGEIPTNLLRKWARAIGCTIDELIKLPDEDEAEEPIFDFDSSLYGALTEDLDLLERDIKRFIEKGLQDESVSPILEQLQDCVTARKEKPWVVLTGHFDAGKSHLCNFYLGGDQLPTGYRPVTRFPTIVRHISDRPQWFKEDLWLMKSGFDPEEWDKEKYCIDNRLLAGSWDTLRTEGHLKGKKDISENGFVLAFSDAPLLHSCVLVDLPGYDDDNMTIENASDIDRLGRRADVLLYLCPAQGFLDSGDLGRLSHLLRIIPRYEAIGENFPIFGNLFIIASHAHPGIKNSQLEDEILKGGSEDLYKHFEENLFTKLSSHGQPISSKDVTARFFSFYQEIPGRRKKLEQDLRCLLGKQMPSIKKKIAEQEIFKFSKQGTAIYAKAIDRCKKIQLNGQETKRYYKWLKEKEPEINDNHNKQVDRIKKEITTFKEEDLKNIRAVFEEEMKVERLESMIKLRYGNNKKDAHRYTSAYVFEKIQYRTMNFREGLIKKTNTIIEEFVQDYDMQIRSFGNANIEEFSTSFDSKDVSSSSALGNPFADDVIPSILEESITSALRRPTRSQSFFLSGMGSHIAASTLRRGVPTPPIAIAASILTLGVIVAVGVSFQVFFGDSWQLRLAKKIKGLFDKKNVLSRVEKNAKSFWKETLTAFNEDAENLDTQYKEYIKELKAAKDAFEGSEKDRQDLEKKVERYEEIKSFFATIPWRF